MAEKVLVTGGAGYIGAHACKALARAGYVPVAFDNLSTGWAEAVKWGPLVKGDLMSRAKWSALPETQKGGAKSRLMHVFRFNAGTIDSYCLD